MRRNVQTILIAVLATLGTAQARNLNQIKADGTLHLYTSADFAPFSSILGSITGGMGKPVGFEVELGNLIAKRIGLRPVWQVKNFDTLIPDIIKNPDVDVLIASHAITSTRAKLVDFTNPHYCTGGVALSTPAGPLDSKAFENQSVGAEAGSTYEGYLRKLPFPVRVKPYATSGKSYAGLVSGQVASLVTDRFAALDAVKRFPDSKLRVGPLLWREEIGMVVAKNNTELRTSINVALAKILQDGSYAKLSQKYFKQDIRC
ncbi:ABC transporter substrate-binding protein [Deinococcus sp.]|uniref:ABC transporter substrate-binding protein n=1 Tax=Deinococcus sp. TaxID=47478 RepID=UPI0025F36E04|nr:ABC transporter substrate-binding protein [Deinococcus sp.]